MVSINKNFNSSQTGATFFNSVDEDGRLVNQASAQPHHFVPLTTIPFSAIHVVVSTAISIVGIVIAIKEPDIEHKCRAYFIMLYLHAAFWFFTLVIDFILKKTHHNLRVNGYLEFYQKTYTLHRAPIYIVSLWNTFLLIIQTLSQHYYPDDFSKQCEKAGILTPAAYITGFIWVETLMLTVIHGQYINLDEDKRSMARRRRNDYSYSLKVSSFNKAQHRPDVQREQMVDTTGEAGGVAGAGNAVGSIPAPAAPLSQTLTQTADLLARQADLIRHLREHNEKLSNKLSTTTTQLRTLQHQQSGDKS